SFHRGSIPSRKQEINAHYTGLKGSRTGANVAGQPDTTVTCGRADRLLKSARVREYLASIVQEDWCPTSRSALAGWVAFYAVFPLYAFSQRGGFLFIDSANLIVHEGGHLLFGWFGTTIGIWGGTILQWSVPLLLALYFVVQRQPTAFAFCLFMF